MTTTESSTWPAPLRQRSAAKWTAYIQAVQQAGLTPPADAEWARATQRVFGFSDFVADSCIRNPQLLLDLYARGDLGRNYQPDTYQLALADTLKDVDSEADLMTVLREYRQREMIRIAWRDLTRQSLLDQTLADLSRLADACVEHAVAYLTRKHGRLSGFPTAPGGEHQQLVVVGLGKLGGEELNFSSDIDLLFAYPQKGQTDSDTQRRSNDEFFTALCRDLLRVLSQKTSDGIVFRVDARLRPFGDNGPLVMSFDAMEQYYQQQGRDWERYAWIKARVVAGDKTAGARLLEHLKPFVYRRYLDFGAFESLRGMKQKIALEVKRRGMHDNIKLGPGGIREIEFFGQIFQLIRGGILPNLQTRRIQTVLHLLVRESLVPEAVGAELTAAYAFLRDLENRLQAFDDQQTHQLPTQAEAKVRLAASMGFADVAAFEQTLAMHRANVHRHFSMLLEPRERKAPTAEQYRGTSAIWQGGLDAETTASQLRGLGYDDPESVTTQMAQFRTDVRALRLSAEGRRRLDQLMPMLLKAAAQSEAPSVTFSRILDLLRAIEGRTAYLALLLENPHCLAHLVRLTCASTLISSFLNRHPVLLDELLDPRTLYLPPRREALQNEIRTRIDRLSGDLEYQMEELRVFKQINVLRVAAADVTGALPLMRVSDHLSDIAETILNEVMSLAWHHLAVKHGTPACRLMDHHCERGFVVIAYGKLGGLELGYGSDLDLVFLHSAAAGVTAGSERPLDNIQFFSRLGQRAIHLLTAHTRAGVLYETDMRLRPSGSSGILVSHIEAFKSYQLHDAWTWEHQALIRARPVAGDAAMRQRFEQIRRDILARKRDPVALHADVHRIREKMRQQHQSPQPDRFDLKQDRGGMVDIEFLVQYLVLLESHQHPELLDWTDNVRLIQTLLQAGVFSEVEAHLLKHAYLIYRAMAHKLSLQEKPAVVETARFAKLRQRVREIWASYLD